MPAVQKIGRSGAVFVLAPFTRLGNTQLTHTIVLCDSEKKCKSYSIYHLYAMQPICFLFCIQDPCTNQSSLVTCNHFLMLDANANANPYHCHHSLSSSSRDGRAGVSFTCVCVERLRFLVGPIYSLSASKTT